MSLPRLPRVHHRSRFSAIAAVSGLLLALGLVLLFQQYGLLYPTPLRLLIASLSSALLPQLVVNFAGRLGARDLNRRLARAEDTARRLEQFI